MHKSYFTIYRFSVVHACVVLCVRVFSCCRSDLVCYRRTRQLTSSQSADNQLFQSVLTVGSFSALTLLVWQPASKTCFS